MNRDHIRGRTTCLMWHEERLCNVGELHRVRPFNPVSIALFYAVSFGTYCLFLKCVFHYIPLFPSNLTLIMNPTSQHQLI